MQIRGSEREGFSLIELVIVIVIMSILTGGIALTYSLVRSADTEGTAYDIDSNLTILKSRNMGRNKPLYLQLYRYSGDIFVDYTEEKSYTPKGNGEVIGDSAVTLSCDGTILPDGSVTTIGIRKKDGAFSEGPKEITVTGDDGTSYVVYLITDTGKHYVEEK